MILIFECLCAQNVKSFFPYPHSCCVLCIALMRFSSLHRYHIAVNLLSLINGIIQVLFGCLSLFLVLSSHVSFMRFVIFFNEISSIIEAHKQMDEVVLLPEGSVLTPEGNDDGDHNKVTQREPTMKLLVRLLRSTLFQLMTSLCGFFLYG